MNNINNNLHTIESIREIIEKIIEYRGYGLEVFKNVQFNKVDNGLVEVELKISKEFTNVKQFTHGGFIAFCLDTFSSFAYVSTLNIGNYNFGVTVNLNISYIGFGKIGERVKVISKVKKITNSFIFTKSKIIKSDGSLIALANVIFKVPPKSKL